MVEDDAQRAALTSPVRLELIEHLAAIGPASVRDLAARVGSTTHALHYHVRQLRDVGLLVPAGSRRSGARDETLYDLIAERIEISMDSSHGAQAGIKTARTILRKAERDFTAIAEAAPERLEAGDGMACRARARLSRGAHKEVLQHLAAIDRIFQRELKREHPPQARTEAFTMTVVFVPEV